MGSYNTTCGISKLPIYYGDEVVDFFIADVGNLREDGFISYPNSLWTPITIQTYGKYDDYGRIDAPSGWHVDYVTNMLRMYAVKLDQGANESHDVPVVPSDIDFNKAQELLHKGRLLMPLIHGMKHLIDAEFAEAKNGLGPISANLRVSRMMVHRFVFDEFVSWGGYHIGTTVSLDEYILDGVKFITKFRNEMKEITDPVEQASFQWRLSLDVERTDNKFLGVFRWHEGGDLYVSHKFNNYLDYLLECDESIVVDVITEMSKFIVFRSRMNQLQFLWSPQIGSQEAPHYELSQLYRLCDRHAQKVLCEGDDAVDDDAADEDWDDADAGDESTIAPSVRK